MFTMEKMTNRQKAALETKKKLLTAAKRIISERGLAGTSVDEITEACGVAKGTFYTYFKRKEDVVYALCNEMFAEILDDAMSRKGTFMERLAFYMMGFASYIEESSLKLCQEWIRNTVEPDVSGNRDGMNKLEFDLKSLKSLFEDGISRGEIKRNAPVEQLAQTLTEVLYGAMLCWATSNGKYDFKEQTRTFCDHSLALVLAPSLANTRSE